MSQQQPSRLRSLWRGWGKPILIVVLVLGTLRSAVADWNDVPTPSMKPTILAGDRIFIDKTAYDWRVPFVGWRIAERGDPKRGDIVIFPSPVDGIRLVKRVIGLPGDRIEIRDHQLLVNGQRIRYEAVGTDLPAGVVEHLEQGDNLLYETLGDATHLIMTTERALAPASFGPLVVPEGRYFMMGDNRDNSLDSRSFGCIPRERIQGRALAVALSVDPDNHYFPRWKRFFTGLP